MRLAIFEGETSVDDLAARLFRLSAGDAESRQRAGAALIEANPHLADLERVPSGSIVVVPDTAHVMNAREAIQPTARAAADLARAVAAHATAFTAGLAEVVAEAAAETDATLKLLNDGAVKAAAEADPALEQHLARLEAKAKAARRDVEDRTKTLQAAMAQMQNDIAQFLQPLTPSPSSASPGRTPGAAEPRATPAEPPARPAARRRRRDSKPK
jgi:hypothetical protein